MNNPSSFAVQAPPRRTTILIIVGLMTGLLLGAMDQTIVATAGPTIIADLGGLSVYAWVFSAYILTQTVSMPIFGKLSDLYGRRRFFVLGLLIFMVGSILSGLSQNIYQLIVFRAVQGIGSGAFFPVAIAVVGVVFPPSLRGRVQGIFASVFGISSVLGPSVGSYLVQAIDWRWVFYINLPLGVVSLVIIRMGLKENIAKDAARTLDWLGISTLTAWIVLLMVGFLNGGSTFSWYSWQEAVFFASAAGLFGAFVIVERRAVEPVIPLSLFRIRTVSSSSAVAFLRGVSFYAIISYVPLLVQTGLGGSVNDGRNVVYAFTLPLIVGAILGGQLGTRREYRGIVVAGCAIMTAGIYLLTSITSTSPLPDLFEKVALAGFGIGLTFATIVLAIQYSVDRSQIGVASSLAQFMGNLGGTIGLAILGTIQANAFSGQLSKILQLVPEQSRVQASSFLSDPNLIGQILATPSALAQVIKARPEVAPFVPALRDAFTQSVIPLFWAGFAVSVATVVAALFITGSMKQQVAARNEAPSGEWGAKKPQSTDFSTESK
ncbi:MAG: MFS transporter [Thaumarchaeota archaeon]|nr:MFS transporter [Nitrososphaerota archaeon]